MNDNNKPFILSLIIVGIIIILLLISKGAAVSSDYQYQPPTMTKLQATSIPSYRDFRYSSIQDPLAIRFVRTFAPPAMHPYTYTYNNTITETYSYPQTYSEQYSTSYETYPSYTDGCDAYTYYSATTGQVCR